MVARGPPLAVLLQSLLVLGQRILSEGKFVVALFQWLDLGLIGSLVRLTRHERLLEVEPVLVGIVMIFLYAAKITLVSFFREIRLLTFS